MAAGRGEFLRSFVEVMESRPVKPYVSRGQRRKGPSGPRRPHSAASTPVRGSERSCPDGRRNRKKESKIPSKEIRFERLPPEILMRILSYLDASSLFCISYVSKLLHRLANEDYVWHNIYMSEFGSQKWQLKSDDAMQMEDRSVGRWKKLYFWTMTGQEMNKWRRELKEISPYTGLPRQTEWVLRNLNVSWELTVCDARGRETTLEQSRVYFFESSVIVRWSRGSFPKYHHIRTLQLHGVRKETPKNPRARRLAWRSLVLKLDLNAASGRFFGKDRLISLIHLSPGFIVGIWRGQSSVAFIMASLHFHSLVEKSLLGSPVGPYSEPVYLPPGDDSDPKFGLHDYTLHFVLHNTGTEMMSGHFQQLSTHTVQMQHGLMELRVIDRTNVSRHRALSGNIHLPWKSESLEGSVENCCVVSMTLLDEFQKPFWCVCSPVSITMVTDQLSLGYSGEHFQMEYADPEGKIEMKLVWLKEQKQFFLISLIIYVAVWKINKYFSRDYSS